MTFYFQLFIHSKFLFLNSISMSRFFRKLTLFKRQEMRLLHFLMWLVLHRGYYVVYQQKLIKFRQKSCVDMTFISTSVLSLCCHCIVQCTFLLERKSALSVPSNLENNFFFIQWISSFVQGYK